MTPEDREKLRLTLVAMGVREASDEWRDYWGGPMDKLSIHEQVERCGCHRPEGCPNMLACKKHKENREAALDQWLSKNGPKP